MELKITIGRLLHVTGDSYETSSLGLPICSYASASLCRKNSLVGRRSIALVRHVSRISICAAELNRSLCEVYPEGMPGDLGVAPTCSGGLPPISVRATSRDTPLS